MQCTQILVLSMHFRFDDRTDIMRLDSRGGSRTSGKGFVCIKVCVRGHFADYISLFLSIP